MATKPRPLQLPGIGAFSKVRERERKRERESEREGEREREICKNMVSYYSEHETVEGR